MSATIKELFVTCVSTSKLNLDNQEGIDYIMSLKHKSNSLNFSNVGGWHSSFLSIEENKFFKKLFNLTGIEVHRFIKNFHYKKSLSLLNFWAIVNSYKDFNLPHSHPSSTISGVYYLKVPSDGGNIVFNNPDTNMAWSIQDEHCNEYNEYNSKVNVIDIEDNLLLLFPSHLSHYVLPNLNKKEDRIIISFNYS